MFGAWLLFFHIFSRDIKTPDANKKKSFIWYTSDLIFKYNPDISIKYGLQIIDENNISIRRIILRSWSLMKKPV